MLPPIYNLLRASSAVVRAVGANIYRHGRAPQETSKPYVTWFQVNAAPENTLSELPSKDRATVQIDVWCGARDGDKVVEQIATDVRNALEPYAHMTGQPVDERESSTGLWRLALQFDFFVDRPLPEPTS
jgi:hypothetical protein